MDLDAGTVRFRHTLSSIDQQLVADQPRPDGKRGKLLVVGPLKSHASQAVLSLPAFAITALRHYQQEQQQLTRALGGQRTPVRLLLVQPGQAPGRSSSTLSCAPSVTARSVPSTPAGRSGPSPKV